MWQTGTATDYFDLLNELKLIATARHVATAAVNSGGTATYVVGDVLTVVGGTNTHVCTLEVTSVSAGVITGVRITNAGAYSVDPTTTANAVTGGGGSGATIDLTMAGTGWTVVRESKRALSASVTAGGNGYNVGDEIEVQGGLGIGVSANVEAAIFTVSTLTGGAGSGVATVTVKAGSEGNYEETPANAAATVAQTGSGDDACTLTVTYESRVPDDHSVLVLEGDATGSPDGPQVGIMTYEGTQGTDEVRNWGLFGYAQAFSSLALMHNQVGDNPGWNISGDDGAIATYSCNLPLKDDDGGGTYPLRYYLSITDRRIMMAVQVETALIDNWVTMYLGFANQFGTTDEIPYPLVIGGTASLSLTSALDDATSPPTSSIVHNFSFSGATAGPGAFLSPAGDWRHLSNGALSAANAFTVANEFNTTPVGGQVNMPSQSYKPGYNVILTTGQFDFQEIIAEEVATAPKLELYPSPDTTNDQYVLFPVNAVEGTGIGNELGDVWYPLGELDGVFWFSYADGGAGAAALDYMDIGTDRYRVFRQGHRSEKANDFFVFRED